MSANTETVVGRVEYTRTETPTMQLLLLTAVLLILGGTLFGLQDPHVHTALHDFRHAAGIVCH